MNKRADDNEHITIIACVRVADGGDGFEAMAFANEGSRYKRVPCPECQAPMYLGTRSSLYLRKYPGAARLLCSPCAHALTAKAEVVMHTNFAQFMDPPEQTE